MNYSRNIKIGALLGVFLSLIIFAVCLAYLIVGNLSAILFSIITFYAVFQILIFIATFFLYIKYSKISSHLVFMIGIIGLFALFAPGVVVLLNYFKQKRKKLL